LASLIASSCGLGGYLIIDLMVLYKIYQLPSGTKRIPQWVSFHCSLMGTASTLLSIGWNWGGLCVDSLGFTIPAAMWGEWMATGPLCVFVLVALGDQKRLSLHECITFASFILCIVCGFSVLFPQPSASAGILLGLAFLFYVPVLLMPFLPTMHATPACSTELEFKYALRRQSMQYNLAVLLAWVLFPVFPIFFILSAAGTVDGTVNVPVMHIFSMLTKGLYAAIVMDAHQVIEFALESELVEERRANEVSKGR